MYRGLTRGRRTGVIVNTTLLVKDDDGFDDIDSFWENTNSSASARKVSSREVVSVEKVTKSTREITPKSALKSAIASPEDGGSATKKLTFLETSLSSDGGHLADDDDNDDGSSFFNDDAFDDVSMPYDTTSPGADSVANETSLNTSSSSVEDRSDRNSGYGLSPAGPANSDSSEEEETEEESEDAQSPLKGHSSSSSSIHSSRTSTNKTNNKRKEPQTPVAFNSDEEEGSDSEQGRAVISDGESAKKPKLTHIVSAEREDSGGSRRSKRSKFPPLAYWKNERYVYERSGEGISEVLPIVSGISERSKTPEPQKKKPSSNGTKKTEVVDMSRVIKDRGISKSDKSKVWNDREQAVRKTRVICRAETMAENEHELPVTATRGSSENKGVGSAAQAFFTPPMSKNTPGWISGYVTLPPKAIKDAEGVGACNQVFFVAETHGKSLEVAIALPGKDGQHVNFDADSAQRYLLGAGDQFFVPPHNVYRLENHSEKKSAKLFWAIIKPVEDNAEDSSEESE